MKEDPRVELSRVKEHLRRVRQAVEMHRKLGEDTAFELRELRREVEKVKSKIPALMESFVHLSEQVRLEGSERLKELQQLCEEAMRDIGILIAAL